MDDGTDKAGPGKGGDAHAKGGLGRKDVAYLRGKADYLRELAGAALKREFVDPLETVRLLERLAREFEQRALEIEREFAMKQSRDL
jgi:hypothetical protein